MQHSPAPPPLPRRIVRTFVAPRQLFEEIRERAPWAGPLLISIVAGMLVVLAVPEAAFVEALEGAVTRRGEPVAITSPPAEIAKAGRMMGMLAVLVRQPLAAFLCAGVLMLVFGVLLRGEGGFPQYLSVTTHAFLVTALGALVAAGIALARGTEPEAVSPALLLPGGDASFAGRVLSSVDLFTVWALVVAAVGVSVVSHRGSGGRAAAVLLGLYLVAAVAVAAVAV